jgi:hypothetical protein
MKLVHLVGFITKEICYDAARSHVTMHGHMNVKTLATQSDPEPPSRLPGPCYLYWLPLLLVGNGNFTAISVPLRCTTGNSQL